MTFVNKVLLFFERKRAKKILRLKYTPCIKCGLQIVGAKHIEIGNSFSCGEDVILEAWDRHICQIFNPKILIGDDVFINRRTHITCINNVNIGDNVLIGSDVLISDNNHGGFEFLCCKPNEPRLKPLVSKGPITIEKNVWIGDKVAILGNVRIGEGSIIGACSVVTKDIPPYSIAVGNPARTIKREQQ